LEECHCQLGRELKEVELTVQKEPKDEERRLFPVALRDRWQVGQSLCGSNEY
jgi:hypothetical protein